jgi:hypothetical protein
VCFADAFPLNVPFYAATGNNGTNAAVAVQRSGTLSSLPAVDGRAAEQKCHVCLLPIVTAASVGNRSYVLDAHRIDHVTCALGQPHIGILLFSTSDLFFILLYGVVDCQEQPDKKTHLLRDAFF